MDTVSKAKRSEVTGLVKGKNTKPEIAVRSLLHSMGYRFWLHGKELPGKPDIRLPEYLGFLNHEIGRWWQGKIKS